MTDMKSVLNSVQYQNRLLALALIFNQDHKGEFNYMPKERFLHLVNTTYRKNPANIQPKSADSYITAIRQVMKEQYGLNIFPKRGLGWYAESPNHIPSKSKGVARKVDYHHGSDMSNMFLNLSSGAKKGRMRTFSLEDYKNFTKDVACEYDKFGMDVLRIAANIREKYNLPRTTAEFLVREVKCNCEARLLPEQAWAAGRPYNKMPKSSR